MHVSISVHLKTSGQLDRLEPAPVREHFRHAKDIKIERFSAHRDPIVVGRKSQKPKYLP